MISLFFFGGGEGVIANSLMCIVGQLSFGGSVEVAIGLGDR